MQLVTVVSADITRVGEREAIMAVEADAVENARVSGDHLVVGVAGGVGVDITGVQVLHEKLASAHESKAWAHLVAKLGGNLKEAHRQAALAVAQRVAKNCAHSLFVRWTETEIGIATIAQSKHLVARTGPPPALLPNRRRQQRCHGNALSAHAGHLLLHDERQLAQHALRQRQQRVDAGRHSANKSGLKQKFVRRNARLVIARRGRRASGTNTRERCAILNIAQR
jgi:hypothetical protein